MSANLSYADAVKLLGGGDKGIVSALDKLTGGLLLAATGGGASFVLSLFDVQGELARLNQGLVSRLGDQVRGLAVSTARSGWLPHIGSSSSPGSSRRSAARGFLWRGGAAAGQV